MEGERADDVSTRSVSGVNGSVSDRVCVFQRAINVTMAVSHMRRLQLAHADPAPPAKTSSPTPLIEVLDVSSASPAPDELDTNGNPSCSHMSLSPHADVSRGRGPLKACYSEPMHALVISETGQHAYHSESELCAPECAANR